MEPDAERPSLAWLAALALGAACALALALLDRALPAVEGEPLALRWARAAADHPVRTALAAACLRLAARRGPPRGPPRAYGGADAGQGPSAW